MICEIINPSDPYTLETEDFNLAACIICFLGSGKLGLREIKPDGSDGESTPVLFGWNQWLDDRGLEGYLDSRLAEAAKVLDSIIIGNVSDRATVLDTKANMDPAKFCRWLARYKDKKRTSMNDIGGAAKQLADQCRKASKKKARATS